MKRTAKKRKKSYDSVITLIVLSFLKWNLICFSVITTVYIIGFLYTNQTESFAQKLFDLLSKLLNADWANYIFRNSYVLLIVAFVGVFLLNCIIYSFSTLLNFARVYKSLNAFTREDKKILSFPKSYSEVELKLNSIRLDVVESRRQALEAERNKDDLVMYLAHDLKTPLTSIIGYLTLLEESNELTAKQRAKFVGISLDKAYRLEQLINEFFEITRFSLHSVTLERNRINLNLMLEQMLDEFYPMLSEKGLTASSDIPGQIVMLADADKLARVFDNLLKNAVNYSYENTEIKIGARIRKNNVIVKIRNRCDEIPEEKLQRIFEKFYRMDASRSSASGGSGLGLAIAKQITELHGGSITAKSTPEYTDFTVVIPYINAQYLADDELDF